MISFINDDVPSNSKSIQISNGSYNNVKLFKLLDLNTIESIMIGDDSFCCVDKFIIDGLNHLKSIKIGSRSFSTIKSAKDWDYNKVKNDSSRSFGILNCAKLESIEIGRFSFVAFGDKFELKNLPSLTSIKIGSIETDYSESNNKGWSLNFYFSSFVIKGMIYDIVNE